MRYLIKYRRRLGDIVACLPAAKHLRDEGHDVWFETDPQFADIFHCVDYVRWANPYLDNGGFDRILDLQIHRGGDGGRRYQEFRSSGRHWIEFVYDNPDISAAAWRRPCFTKIDWFDPKRYRLPATGDYAIVGSTGVSQQQRHDPRAVATLASKLYPGAPIVQLSAGPTVDAGFVFCRRLRDLPGLIAHARHCLLINSGPNIIAAAVRDSHHLIPQTGPAAQDNMNYGTAIEVRP